MPLPAATKAQIMKTYQRAKNDTGSPEVQIALLTARIEGLTGHLKTHAHDFHTRHGLTKMVSERRKLLAYLKRVNPKTYRTLIQQLDVRG